MEQTINTVCGICFDNCGMEVKKEGDEIRAIRGMREHPHSAGNLCIKGLKAKEIALSPLRLKSPLKKTGGEFKEITWDEAFDYICRGLEKLEKEHGSESLAVYFGDPIIFQGMAMYLLKLFCQTWGTPNLACTGSLCNISKVFANMITFGRWSSPHFEKSDYIILWGTNPLVSTLRGRTKLLNQKERKVKTVVIDPRVTQSSRIADWHIHIKPGTDGALAMGMIKTIIDENLYDKPFIDRHTVGFEELKKAALSIKLEEIEKCTGVSKNILQTLAREFAKAPSACIDQGSSLEQHTNGIQNVRAVAALLTITGNIDREGGNILPAFPITSQPKASSPKAAKTPAAGSNEHPLFTNFFRQGQAMVFPELLERRESNSIRGMIVDGGNMAMTWPDSARTGKFLSDLDILVTIDTFMSETAKLSHIVLPASFFLERTELSLQQPLSIQRRISHPGNTFPDWKIWSELLKRTGAGNEIPWSTEEEGITYLLKPSGKTYDDLIKNPLAADSQPAPIGNYLEKGFPTKSGKIELSAGILLGAGYEAVPSYVNPAETPDNEFPLILTTGGRIPSFNHSQFHNIPSLRELCPEPFFEINSADAGKMGIANDEICKVETRRGKIKIKARVTQKIMQGTIHILHGWEEANVNLLSDIGRRDPVSGFPSLKSIACRVVKD